MFPFLPVLAAHTLPQQSQIIHSLVSAEVYFAAAVLVIGFLFLVFGFKAYRWIVVINCVALGFYLGGLLGEKERIATVAAVIGALVLGAISWPLMKYAVAICGGLVGAVVGMVVWNYFEQPADMAWAGGIVGLAVLGLLSFCLFKTSVILFTCVQGAAMFVLGAAALLIKCSPWAHDVSSNLTQKPILMPILVATVAIFGLLWQHQRHGLIGHNAASASGSGSSSSSADNANKK
ncbi:MAG: hypothetical protein FWD61_12175 [Phycisphaerales bacterium]|nr:hypothetical protein [Phycisphaerales bacterium]